MSIRNLRIFEEVYQTENISKAAEHLYLAQPAVSRSIKELETEYEVSLFERRNHRLIKTEAADLLHAKADLILKNYDSLKPLLKESAEEATIRLGTNTTAASFFIPSVVSSFKEKYPHVRLEVFVNNEVEIMEMLKQNRIDLALVENNISQKNYSAELIGQSVMCAICAYKSSYPKKMNLSDITQYPLLLREKGSAQRNYIDALLQSHDISVSALWQSSSTSALIHACMHDIGIAFVPESFVKDLIQKKKLRKILISDEDLIRNCYLVQYAASYISEPKQYLIDAIKEKYQAETI